MLVADQAKPLLLWHKNSSGTSQFEKLGFNWAIPKKPKQMGLTIYFFEDPLSPTSGDFRFVTLTLEIQKKASLKHLFEIQKPRPMKIPHEFFSFLNTPGNPTFLIDPWNFHMLFLHCPWKFHVLNSPPALFFFLNSPFQSKVRYSCGREGQF